MIVSVRTNKSNPPRIVRFAPDDAIAARATVLVQFMAGCMPREAAKELLEQIERVTKKIREC